MQAEQVGQPSAGDVANASDVFDVERGLAASRVQQVNHGVAVDTRGVEDHFAKRRGSLCPSQELPPGVVGLKWCECGVVQPGVLHDFSDQGIAVGMDPGSG